MRQFNLSKYRKICVWLGGLPNATFPSDVKKEVNFKANNQEGIELKLALEVMVPLGARSMYGLLGGEFFPSSDGVFTVLISSGSNNEKEFTSSLVYPEEKVWAGLPVEYCRGVKEGLILAQKKGQIPSGKFIINCAAYSEISSCEFIFQHITLMALKIISLNRLDLTDQEIISIFPDDVFNG